MSTATFLNADRSLTKTFYKDGTSEPYPLVREFSSFIVEYNSIEEFKEILEMTGSTGACLLKGNLSKEISNEPRAGLTDSSEPTSLLIIDYDSDAGFASIPDLLTEIDPNLADTDYIFQHSASSGITGKSGLRGHVFLFLSNPVSPAIIKQWLKKVNLTSDAFRKCIKLSRNAMSLCYALDITVNQNDKLIYIAPPKLIGLEDPIEQRFTLHKGEQRTFTFGTTVSAEANRTKEHDLIEALQDAAGLPKRTPKYKIAGDFEILTNPANCIVTDSKDCGKFVRVNLNGGDSFAYWYAKDNSEVLHNFKGEPSVYLRDIAPEYFELLQSKSRETSLRPFVFRDVATNIFFNAEWDEQAQRLSSCYRSDKKNLADFMLQRGAPAPRVVPDWTMFFNPASKISVDFTGKQLNLFTPTKYMEVDPNDNPGAFPTIRKVLQHICVDAATYHHFIKWLAHIMQFRTKTQTAWIFSGTEGTGKGTLFHQILTPLFGQEQSHLITQDQADEQYNGYLQRNMILYLDEGDVESSKQADRMLAKFRSIITEPTIPLRQMRANVVQAPSFTNLIIATNKSLPIKITAGDRRYNVAPRQNKKIELSLEEYNTIKNELGIFSAHLKAQKISSEEALSVLYSEARTNLLEMSKTVADEFFDALKEGDLDFFAERLQETMPINDMGYVSFAKIVQQWMHTAGETIQVTIDDMVSVYKYIGGNDTMNAKRFGFLTSRHEFKSTTVRLKGIRRNVFTVTFNRREYTEWLERSSKSNVITLQGKK